MELSNKEIFKDFCGILENNDENLKSLLDIRNDVIFLWEEEGRLVTQGTRAICTNKQQLIPTQRPDFPVSNLSVNESGNRAVLWGPEGVAIIHLPWRCGPKLDFQNGQAEVVVRCHILHQLELAFDAQVVQVRWNSSTTHDTSLVILISDNSIYHIDVSSGEAITTDCYSVGCRPISRQRTLAALGETAVDFCFVPWLLNPYNHNACPLLVLRGNGDVLLVQAGSEEDEQNLPISPLPQDNYLSDACSILAIPGKPGGVVVATTRGVVYHTLLVPLDADQVDVPHHHRRYRLLVVESVVVDAGLLHASDDLSPFPLRLVLDPNHARRYLIIQPRAVHSVLMTSLSAVEDMLEHGTQRMASSVIEYLVCSGDTMVGAAAYPYSLVTLDSMKKVLVVPLRRVELPPLKLFSPEEDSGEITLSTNQLRQPFEQQLEKLLRESHVLPQLSLPKDQLSLEQRLTLCVRIGELIRKVTIPHYQQVHAILNQRVRLINAVKAVQTQELERLNASRASIQLAAEEFAEKMQLVSEEQENLQRGVQKMMRLVAEAQPTLTDAERRLEETVTDIQTKLSTYQESLEKVKKNIAYQDAKIREEVKDKERVLSTKQVSAIYGCLSVIGENISQLVGRVNNMKHILALDD